MSFRMSCFLVEMPADADVPASSRDETKTRMVSTSLMGSIVTGLGETYIKAFFRSLVRNKIKELIFTKF